MPTRNETASERESSFNALQSAHTYPPLVVASILATNERSWHPRIMLKPVSSRVAQEVAQKNQYQTDYT